MELVQLLELTESQRNLLLQVLRELEIQELAIRFNEPEQDQLRMRQHANLVGKREAITYLLFYDEKRIELNRDNFDQEN